MSDVTVVENVVLIKVGSIARFKQPRKHFDNKSLRMLANSIANEGQQVPVTVTPDSANEGKYILIDGERRWRAHNLLWELSGEEPTIKAIVKPVADFSSHLEESFISNLHRDSMTPLDIAQAMQNMRDRRPHYYTYKRLAELMGKSQLWVNNQLKLNNLPDDIKSLMDLNIPKRKRLSPSVAIEIASSTRDPDTMRLIANSVIDREMTISDTRYFIRNELGGHVVSKQTENTVAYNQSRSFHNNGKKVMQGTEYAKLCHALGVIKNRVGYFKGMDMEQLLAFRDDPAEDAQKLQDTIWSTILELNKMKDQLDKVKK